MLKCKEVSYLLSESQDRKLAFYERLHLEMHLAMCQGCRNLKSQRVFIRLACKRYVSRGGRERD